MAQTPPVTELSATKMSELLAAKEVSSEELTRAHLARIEALDGKLRAFTEVFHRRAMHDAREADASRARGDVRGPLHGLPVSVKECLDMEGLATTLGVPSKLTHRAATDSVVVQMLREQGAVILGRTNLSQLMLFAESRNPIFGQTANPWSLAHSAGGSSGGEGAAIASGMSPLGVGTDIGGSIRGPAHVCGIAGLKPTLDRWSARGVATALVGQEAVRGTVGPLARTSEDIALAMTALDPARMAALDPRVPPLTFADPRAIDVSTLRVGYLKEDGLLRTSHALVRAIDRAAEVLAARGCNVVPFTPPNVPDAIYTYFAALSSDGAETVARIMGRDRIDPVLAGMNRIVKLPPRVRNGAARLASLLGEPSVARLLSVLGEKRVSEYWALTQTLRAYRLQMQDAFDAAQIDVLLVPPHATPALPHGYAQDFAIAGSPSMLWNLVQFPAGVVPVTRVRAAEARRDGARERLDKRAAEVDRASLGLPVGVQVVARAWREDLVVAAMIAIEAGVRNDGDFPKTPVAL